MPAEEKEALILECLTGRLQMREAARRAGHSTMESWVSRYRSEGRVPLKGDGNQTKRSHASSTRRRTYWTGTSMQIGPPRSGSPM